MTGTLINIATVLIGGMIGAALWGAPARACAPDGHRWGWGCSLPPSASNLSSKPQNAIIVLGSLLLGGLLGEWLAHRRRPAQPGRLAGKTLCPPHHSERRDRSRAGTPLRARLPDRLAGLLRGADDHPRLHSGWADTAITACWRSKRCWMGLPPWPLPPAWGWACYSPCW